MITLDQAGAGRARCRPLAPPAALRSRVEHLWLESPVVGGRPGDWRIVADPCAHLLYHRFQGPGGGIEHRLALSGPRTVAVDIDRSRRSLTAGVRLRPGSVPALLDVRADELTDRSVRLEHLLGGPGAELLERLAASPSTEVPAVLAAWLATRPRSSETRSDHRVRRATASLALNRTTCATAASPPASARVPSATSCTPRSA